MATAKIPVTGVIEYITGLAQKYDF